MKEYIVKCSNCDRELVHIIQLTDTSSTYKLMAHCPCGDHSFFQELTGKFHLEGINCEIGPIKYEEDRIDITCK